MYQYHSFNNYIIYVFTDQDTLPLETDHLKLSITSGFLLPTYIYNYISVFADVLSWLHSEWKWFKALNTFKTFINTASVVTPLGNCLLFSDRWIHVVGVYIDPLTISINPDPTANGTDILWCLNLNLKSYLSGHDMDGAGILHVA